MWKEILAYTPEEDTYFPPKCVPFFLVEFSDLACVLLAICSCNPSSNSNLK